MAAAVGHTPYVRYVSNENNGSAIFIKMEGYNPSGSVKDRACLYMLESLLESGKLKKGMILLDASSGNFASALAYYGKILGFKTEVVVSSKITKEKEAFIRYFGAGIRSIGDFTIDGNLFCRQLVESDSTGRYCFLDQLHNWNNPEAHYKSTGPEILKEFCDVDAVVGSLGSGGTMLGVGRYFKETKPDTKIIAVQALAGTRIPGTGSFDDGDYITPFIREGMNKKVFDHTVKIDLPSAEQRSDELKERGIFCGLQTGGVVHAAIEMIRNGSIAGNIVVISGDSGWKNLEKLTNIKQPAVYV
jgi:[CysO sulfur-carrier protein]-thiocarboxylate-dependent cysteine synthase